MDCTQLERARYDEIIVNAWVIKVEGDMCEFDMMQHDGEGVR